MKDYAINFATNTITVSRAFQRRASQMGTDAFNTMMNLRKLNMKIVAKDTQRRNGNRLTYNKIIRYLETFEDKESRLADFAAVRIASKVQDNPYKYVVDWFDEAYPIRAAKPQLTADHKIIPFSTAKEKTDADNDTVAPKAQEKVS